MGQIERRFVFVLNPLPSWKYKQFPGSIAIGRYIYIYGPGLGFSAAEQRCHCSEPDLVYNLLDIPDIPYIPYVRNNINYLINPILLLP